jgi:hypothetical protein
MDRLAQLERLEAWCATVNARERFLIGAVVGLIQALLVSWILSWLPPLPTCDWDHFDPVFGVGVADVSNDPPSPPTPAAKLRRTSKEPIR